MISRRLHVILDYAMGVLLFSSPWLFGFEHAKAARWCVVTVGFLLLVISFFTDYEDRAKRAIPMSAHLMIDGLIGVLLAASPWLFHFNDNVYLPHMVLGITEVGLALFTQRKPEPIRNFDTKIHSLP
ncbi:SPW repeat protein [Mucilaginibacter sp. RS28]|uniref:SPW repeat protein n=2 Tax=Mucilaginibacter straminoryzae TaxID=2932774 RepID=A0A9X1X5H3_9SPHI|nr:SPW repeat protein [Mucilaginibacter straminoryzae]